MAPREAECHWPGGCSNYTSVSALENIWKKGELKELSESTGHRKIMFPDIVQIQCLKQLYRDLISINIYFAFFSFYSNTTCKTIVSRSHFYKHLLYFLFHIVQIKYVKQLYQHIFSIYFLFLFESVISNGTRLPLTTVGP